MAKTANLYARIEPNLKMEAEQILNALGLPPSSAITMFYKQIVMRRGLPFDVSLNYRMPLNLDTATFEEVDQALEMAMEDVRAGRTYSVEEVLEEFNKEFGL